MCSGFAMAGMEMGQLIIYPFLDVSVVDSKDEYIL